MPGQGSNPDCSIHLIWYLRYSTNVYFSFTLQEYISLNRMANLIEVAAGAAAADATTSAVQFIAAKSSEGFFISLKINSSCVAALGLAGAIGLGAWYLSRKDAVTRAVRWALERQNPEGGVDPEVREINEGSIVVSLICHTKQSFLRFWEDYKASEIKERLEKEFKKIGFSQELEVTVMNAEEVHKQAKTLR